MALSFVVPEPPERQTLNVLLYGAPGAGKTCGACSAPGPILAVNAEGPGAFAFARKLYGDDHIHEVTFTGRDTLREVYLHLKDGTAAERTVVIDTVGECYRVLLAEIAGEGRPSLQNFGDVITMIDRFIRSLRDVRVNVVLTAHEQIDDADGDRIVRPDTGGKKLPEQVMAMMDVVAYCAVIPPKDDQPARYVGQLVEDRGRRCKDRSGALGVFRDVDLSEWLLAAASTPVAPRTPVAATPDPEAPKRATKPAPSADVNVVAQPTLQETK